MLARYDDIYEEERLRQRARDSLAGRNNNGCALIVGLIFGPPLVAYWLFSWLHSKLSPVIGPEPATWALWSAVGALALLGLALWSRRIAADRRRAAAEAEAGRKAAQNQRDRLKEAALKVADVISRASAGRSGLLEDYWRRDRSRDDPNAADISGIEAAVRNVYGYYALVELHRQGHWAIVERDIQAVFGPDRAPRISQVVQEELWR